MPHLEAQIPQGVEHVLDHALGERRLLVGTQEQKIEVREGGHGAAPVAADRQKRQPLALGGVARSEDVDGGEVEQGGDHLVRHPCEKLGGFNAACTVFEPLLGDHPAPEKGRLQDFQRPRPLFSLIAQRIERGCGQLSPQSMTIDDIFDARRAKAAGHDVYSTRVRRR